MILRFLGIGGLAGLIVSAALGLLLVIQKGETRHWHKQSDQWEQKAGALQAQLEAISTARNDQKVITETKLKLVTRTLHDADEKAKQIESAPDEGGCKTSRAILEADL